MDRSGSEELAIHGISHEEARQIRSQLSMSLNNLQRIHIFWSPGNRRIYARDGRLSLEDAPKSGTGRPELPPDAVFVDTYEHGADSFQVLRDVGDVIASVPAPYPSEFAPPPATFRRREDGRIHLAQPFTFFRRLAYAASFNASEEGVIDVEFIDFPGLSFRTECMEEALRRASVVLEHALLSCAESRRGFPIPSPRRGRERMVRVSREVLHQLLDMEIERWRREDAVMSELERHLRPSARRQNPRRTERVGTHVLGDDARSAPAG